jgi:hypothetical protein|tara:strand:- start:3223 stop:3420 length:198 start_codon:yes stop_codon:yes gene_type:complete
MTTKNSLETQVKDLTQKLEEAQAKTQQLASALGQMRYRVFEVLELEPTVRNKIVKEIDTVFRRVL